jgi:Fe-S-cluster containining protein
MGLWLRCNGCGRCCKSWTISLSVKDVKRLNRLGYKTSFFVNTKGNILAMKLIGKDRRCIFLNDDNSCKIHKEHGFSSKPSVCRIFPEEEVICGEAYFVNKKPKASVKYSSDYFFLIGSKLVYTKVFYEMLDRLKFDKSLVESYYGLLLNIIKQKDNIIIDPIDLDKESCPIPKKIKQKLKYILLLRSKGFFPELKIAIGKDIMVSFPTRDLKLNLKNYPSFKIKRSFLQVIKRDALLNSRRIFYPITLFFTLYFLPYVAVSLAGNGKVKEGHCLEAFALLNSIWRFSGLDEKGLRLIHSIQVDLIKSALKEK